jgi:hypothetical protein
MRVHNNGGGTGGGHQDILIGDPTMPPVPIDPHNHSPTWPVNFWHWVWSEVSAGPVGIGAIQTMSLPGDTWTYSLTDGTFCFSSAAGTDVRLRVNPAFQLAGTGPCELAMQWQMVGITSETLKAAYDVAAMVQIGWGVLPNTLGFGDGLYFEKHAGDSKIYACISDAVGDHVDVDTGATLDVGEYYKFAIRHVADGAAWIAYFYIDDQLVYTNNSTVLTWWPNVNINGYMDVSLTAPADGFVKQIGVKGPWVLMGR